MPTAVESTVQNAANGAFNSSQDFLKAMGTLDQAMTNLARSAPNMTPPEYSRALNILKQTVQQLDRVATLFNNGQKSRQRLFQVCVQSANKVE